MGDFFHEKADRDLFFSSFGNDIGSRLDRLKFEFEAIENGTIPEEPEIIIEDVADAGITLENKVQSELEKNIENDIRKEPKERTRSYTLSIQRAFSTVSLMTNFKSSFWKKRREKNPKKHDVNGRERSASTSSNPEKNNNGLLKVTGESEGRATIYSTVPRPSKQVQRSKTMSPSTNKPVEQIASTLETLERDESGNVYVPPVVVDGQLVYDYQYATPREGSPVPKSPKKDPKLKRRNSLSRLLNIRKSPRKSPKKDKNTTPIKQLYEKTVLSASKQENLDKVGLNGHATPEKEGSKNVTPEKETSKTATPEKETSKTVTPEKETSKIVTSEKSTPESEKNGKIPSSVTSEKTGNTVKPEKTEESEEKQVKKPNGIVKNDSSSAVHDTAV